MTKKHEIFLGRKEIIILYYRHEGKQQKVIAYNTQYGTVRLNNKTVVGPDTKTACKEGDHVRISLRYCNVSIVVLLDFSFTVKVAPHECVISTSQP